MTSFVEAFPASPSALQESDLPKKTSDGFGPSSHDAFAYYDPYSCSWKTCQGSFLPECQTYSETWPRAGMTRNGTAYRRPPLVPRNAVTESGLLPNNQMYPTPKSSPSGPDFARANRQRSGGDDLATAVARMYPAPTVACATGGQTSRGGDRKDEPLLAGIVGGPLNPAFVEWLMGFPLGWTDLEDSGTP